MAANSFIASIKSKRTKVYQNAYTGFFYTTTNNGRHIPVSYTLIRTQTTSMQRLKYWRNRYGYTQADLARLIHVSSPTIVMMWENGLRHPRKEYRKLLNAELCSDIFPD